MTEHLSDEPIDDLQEGHFQALLNWLHPDFDQAGQVYEQLRRRLMKLFQCHGCLTYEEAADEVLHRVARRIGTGDGVKVDDPFVFCHGFARNVLREYWRKQERQPVESLENRSPHLSPSVDPHQLHRQEEERVAKEHQLDCLQQCLDKLDSEERTLFLDYHREVPGTKIDRRDQLARQIGVTINTLRIRICRIKDRLEQCIKRCTQAKGQTYLQQV